MGGMSGGQAAALLLTLAVIGGLITLIVWATNSQCPKFGRKCTSGPTAAPRSGTGDSSSSGGGSGPQAGARGPSTAGGPGAAAGGPRAAGGPLAVLGYNPNADGPLAGPISGPVTGPTSAPVSGRVNCQGHWGNCNGTCGTDKIKTWIIDVPAANGGDPCRDSNGNELTATSTTPCGDLGPCGQDCLGAWVVNANTDADGWTACPSCGPGNQVRTWQNDPTKPQIPPGLACTHTNGYQETRACTNQTACPQPVNCVGSWGPYTACSLSCGSGTKTKTYTITTNASNGGAHCIDPDDGTTDLSTNTAARVKSAACGRDTAACTNADSWAGAWTYSHGDCGSNNPDGRPYQVQTRDIVVGGRTQGDAAECCLALTRTVYTTAGCGNQNPTGGTCSYGTYNTSSTPRCATPSGTVAATGGTCDSATFYDSGWTYSGGGTFSAAGCTYRGSKQTCYAGGMGYSTCSTGYTNSTFLSKVTGVNCPANYTRNGSGTDCKPVTNAITNINCPTGYTIGSGGVTSDTCVPTTACTVAGSGASC